MTFVVGLLVAVLMVGALLVIPFGVPGVWIMVLLLLVGTFSGTLSWSLWLFLVGLALVAELGEFWILKRVGDRYGASKKAFWGAIIGGFIGVLIGTPVPVVGSVLAGFLGTFVGAGAVTLWESRSLGAASKVGVGVLVARTLAISLKIGVGVVVFLLGGLRLIIG